ncbi:MAG: tRNA uridine(34) 5-carboxymethylaminomethyl modification radical SAM/GNAT enzyme Elp3 [Candidatus Altimarinota bacterium]
MYIGLYEKFMQSTFLHEFICILLNDSSLTTKRDYQKVKNTLLAKYGNEVEDVSSIEVLEFYREGITNKIYIYDSRVWKILRKRGVRSLSGVSVISLLTKFWGCPGKCIYCPTYDGLPKSYITGEPAVQRAEMNEFDPVRQVQNRLRSLEITGNAIAKCDVRIIGGTWSVYPLEYQEMFIKGIYDAHTTYSDLRPFLASVETGEDVFARFKVEKGFKMKASETLEDAKERNQTAESRVIGIAIETRPDWITPEEIIRLRKYGITRVEIGYQTTDDTINLLNKRGHGNKESIEATRLLKDAGFKVVAHMMPNLLGSTPEKDRWSMKEVFESSDFRPDELKIYPMVVTPYSELENIWRTGGFRAYDDDTLINLMADLQGMIPEYVRLNRMYRDIPADQILAGSKLANLRQLTEAKMKEKSIMRLDISSREIRAKGNNPHDAVLDEYFYEASGGHEYFLQYIDPNDRTIFGLLRLRIPSQYFTREKHFVEVLEGAAIVRELHVFGDQLSIGGSPDGSGQHMGFGKKLMRRAEEIVQSKYPEISKLAVIAGVGVRKYYEKLGYFHEEEYMIKPQISEN